jgi:Xaa-Pro aminopeptidase
MTVVPAKGLHLTTEERDRRYALLRKELAHLGVDCLIASGSNSFYLTNGIPGERAALFFTDPAIPTVALINGRHLADIPEKVAIDSQDWIDDVRGSNDIAPLTKRIGELGLGSSRIGLAQTGGVFRRLVPAGRVSLDELPNASFVDVSGVFDDIRSTKSLAEVALIEQANRVFDAGIQRVYEKARPGMTGAELTREGTVGMSEAGGDLDSTMDVGFGSVPKQNPLLQALDLDRQVQSGDTITITGHSEYQHYAGHSDQEISLGQPSALHQEMFDAVCNVREHVLSHVRPGATQGELIDAYQQRCRETGFLASPHSQIHQYGIDVPEFPGPLFRIGGSGGRGDFTLAPGMIYSISPTVVATNREDTVLGGTCLVVTDDGYRELGERKVELLIR